ncbi:hypothetical protein [Dictyobacter arantiisoli]|uniref:Uncharacterized protein n=1 Tax=Dictyobacter arantiisoli TaxID=2014874 RepID=A0A5A5TI52_9CHLR|nr:hypothetical protein [Dictyobacter arantiisoli]GCF11270.1 hypothetical protein KDI_48340 [Dictyobacter arantiisoli]
MTIHTLVPSTTRGRYALDRPDGADISSGQYIRIQCGCRWIAGSVEMARASAQRLVHGTVATDNTNAVIPVVSAYYFTSEADVYGLCVGQKVQVP